MSALRLTLVVLDFCYFVCRLHKVIKKLFTRREFTMTFFPFFSFFWQNIEKIIDLQFEWIKTAAIINFNSLSRSWIFGKSLQFDFYEFVWDAFVIESIHVSL